MEYKLLGKVNVPEEKKAELNEYILAALYRGGIRKTCEVVLDGLYIPLLSLRYLTKMESFSSTIPFLNVSKENPDGIAR